jgi:hypothetical protein
MSGAVTPAGFTLEVARVRITEAGRRALAAGMTVGREGCRY